MSAQSSQQISTHVRYDPNCYISVICSAVLIASAGEDVPVIKARPSGWALYTERWCYRCEHETYQFCLGLQKPCSRWRWAQHFIGTLAVSKIDISWSTHAHTRPVLHQTDGEGCQKVWEGWASSEGQSQEGWWINLNRWTTVQLN